MPSSADRATCGQRDGESKDDANFRRISDTVPQFEAAPLAPAIQTNCTNGAEPAQAAKPQVRPWIRFWARMFDVSVFGFFFAFFVVGLIAIAAPKSNLETAIFARGNKLWLGMASLFAWVFVEAILLTTLGTTPGKWLFKIKLIPPSGPAPTFPAAFSRSISVWWRGLGAGFPYVILFTLMRADRRLIIHGITSWDRDDGFAVVHQRIGLVRGLAALGCFATPCLLMATMDAPRGTSDASRDTVGTAAAVHAPLPQKQKAVAAIPSSTSSSARKDIARSVDQIADSDERRAPAVNQSPARPKPRSDYREVERFVSEIVDQLDAEQDEYNLELQALGWNSILDPWHIKDDKTLAKSRAMTKQASSIVNKHEAKTATLIRDIRSRFYTLPVSDEVKQELVARFDRCIIYARLGELWALRKQAVGQFSKVFDLLASTKRGVDWSVENGQLAFARQSGLLAKFNSYVKEMQRIVEKQQRIREEGAAMSNQWLKEERRRAESGQ